MAISRLVFTLTVMKSENIADPRPRPAPPYEFRPDTRLKRQESTQTEPTKTINRVPSPDIRSEMPSNSMSEEVRSLTSERRPNCFDSNIRVSNSADFGDQTGRRISLLRRDGAGYTCLNRLLASAPFTAPDVPTTA
jgi:hypothetical protein